MLQQSDINETLKKIEEEAFEVIDAVKLKNKSNIVHEVADLVVSLSSRFSKKKPHC